MANVLHRTSGQYFESVNTPEYDELDWLINPDLSQVAGVQSKYWKVVGDTVVEMSEAEKQVVDASTLPQASTLSSGSPAYIYQGNILGVSKESLDFFAKATGVKSFNLPYKGVKKQCFVTKRCAVTSVEQDEEAHVLFMANIYKNGQLVDSSNVRNKDCLLLLEVGDILSVQVVSAIKLTDPIVTLLTSERD